MSEEIQSLIERLETLELTLSNTQSEVAHIRRQLRDVARSEGRSEEKPKEGLIRVTSGRISHTTRSLQVGDRVRILNAVKLTGHTHPIHNCQGVIDRFTRKRFVIVHVHNKKRPAHLRGVFDEVRRERQNVELIEDHEF